MSSRNLLESLFILNATVLCTHQIDAAFWHEWDLFRIPGGNQVNLMLNIPLIASVFVAFRVVAQQSPRYRLAHKYLVSLGFLTVFLHTGFFAFGYVQFLQPMSLLLLAATGILSGLQLITLARSEPQDLSLDTGR